MDSVNTGSEEPRLRKNAQNSAGASGDNVDQAEETPLSDSKEEKSVKDGCRGLPNLYNRFVESFENALHTVTDGNQCSPRKLKSLTIEGVAEYIKKEQPRNIVVMTGAGISTSAGIPDFRSPGSGLYDNLQKYDLPDPQAIFTIDFFDQNPAPFFTLAKELFPDTLKPTPCHYLIRLLEKKGMLRRWYTQNIDSMEHLTGIPEDKLVSAHGDHHTSTCRKCKAKYDLNWISEKLKDSEVLVPKCEKCEDGVVKPDIVFFGESLPKRFFQCAISDFPNCDLLLIMGTSLVVQPFASMVNEVDHDCPRLLINLEEAGRSGPLERVMGITGLCYGVDGNKRDVFWKGTCDDGALRLASLLGWERDLDAMIEKGPIPLKQKMNRDDEEKEEEGGDEE